MARIPITDIPNAPQVGNPTLLPQLPNSPGRIPLDVSGLQVNSQGLQQADSLLTQTRRGLDRSTAGVADATAGTKTPLIDANKFMAPYEGAAEIGKAFQASGAVIGDYAHSMALAQDADVMSQASIIMHQTFAEHAQDAKDGKISTADVVPTWQNDKLPAAQDAIAKLNPSGRIAGRLKNDFAQWSSEGTLQFGDFVAQKNIATMGGHALDAADLDAQSGNLEGASNHLQEAQNVGIITPEQKSTRMDGYISTAKVNQAVSTIQANPTGAAEAISAAQSGTDVKGDPEYNPFKDFEPAQLVKFKGMADAAVRERRFSALDSADGSIESGAFTKPEQVDQFAKQNPELLPQDVRALQKSMLLTVSQSPAGQAQYKAGLSDLYTKIADYNPSNDPKQSQLGELRQQILTSATGYDKEDLNNKLSSMVSDGRKGDDQTRALLYRQVDNWQKNGLFGSTPYDSTTKSYPDAQAYGQIMQKTLEAKKAVDAYLKQNPGATPADAQEGINKIYGGVISSEASKSVTSPAQSGLGGAIDRAMSVTPAGAAVNIIRGLFKGPSPSDINQQIDQKLGGKPVSGLFNNNGSATASNSTPGTVDKSTLDFVKGQEGFSSKPFADYHQTSIGYGTVAQKGDTTITQQEAEKRLTAEIQLHAVAVDKAIAQSGIQLSPTQRDALISFDFNTGQGSHLITTSHSAAEIAARLPTWNKVTVDGKLVENKGLTNRRAAELAMFNA